MDRKLKYAPQFAFLLAGVAVAALTGSRRGRGGTTSSEARELKRSLAEMESRLAAQEQSVAAHLSVIDARLDEHAAKLEEVPSTTEIATALGQLLSTTMASLEKRLAEQAASIEALKITATQTDGFLERVLELQGPLAACSGFPESSPDWTRRQPTEHLTVA